MITRLENPAEAAELFGSFEDTMVLSCLSGMMGGVYAVAEWPLCSAAAVLGDFAFFAGQPSEELLRFRPDGRPYALLTPPERRMGGGNSAGLRQGGFSPHPIRL
ncbi:MAG: GNAT family N-acetyltransferase [Lachnospiraceae bacterium]